MDVLQTWWEIPSIAHFCSLFRTAFSLPDFDIEELEEGFLASATEDGSPFLDDLFCRLLQGCYSRDDIEPYNYEIYLKDCVRQRWEVEEQKENPMSNTAFRDLNIRCKVEILHALCDYRLDCVDVMDQLKGYDGDNLRVEALGQDGNGATYWYFYGNRLYKEDQEEIKHEPKSEKKRKVKKNKSKQKGNNKNAKQANKSKESSKPKKKTAVEPSSRNRRVSNRLKMKGIDEEIDSEESDEDDKNYDSGNDTPKTKRSSSVKNGNQNNSRRVSSRSNKRLSLSEEKAKLNDDKNNESSSDDEPLSQVKESLQKCKLDMNELKEDDRHLSEVKDSIKQEDEAADDDVPLSKVKDSLSKCSIDKSDVNGVQEDEGDSNQSSTNREDLTDRNEGEEGSIKMGDHEIENVGDVCDESNKPVRSSGRRRVPVTRYIDEYGDDYVKVLVEKTGPRPRLGAGLRGMENELGEVMDKRELTEEEMKEEEEKERILEEKKRENQEAREAENKRLEALSAVVASKMALECNPRWHLVCVTLEDWENLAQKFKDAELTCEKDLYECITVDFLPAIPEIIEAREKERRKRLLEMAPRRQSSRIGQKRREQEEQEKILAEAQELEDKQRQEEEEEKRKLMELEKAEEERRMREERQKAREERAKRLELREIKSQLIAAGKEIPPELQYSATPNTSKYREDEERPSCLDVETLEGMKKVLETVKDHKDSWAFLEPVDEEVAPGYHDIIKRPMDLSIIEKKLENKLYRSTKRFVGDFNLMVSNCKQFSGVDSELGSMAHRIQRCMMRSVKLNIDKDNYEEDDDFKLFQSVRSEKKFRPKRAASSRAMQTLHRAMHDESESEDSDDSDDNPEPYRSKEPPKPTRLIPELSPNHQWSDVQIIPLSSKHKISNQDRFKTDKVMDQNNLHKSSRYMHSYSRIEKEMAGTKTFTPYRSREHSETERSPVGGLKDSNTTQEKLVNVSVNGQSYMYTWASKNKTTKPNNKSERSPYLLADRIAKINAGNTNAQQLSSQSTDLINKQAQSGGKITVLPSTNIVRLNTPGTPQAGSGQRIIKIVSPVNVGGQSQKNS